MAEIISRYFDGQTKGLKVLDVGGLGSLLGDMLPGISLTIFDNETEQTSETQKKGDGAHMSSIKSGSYDIVISCDTLEHIPRSDRKDFIGELVRASSDLVIMCSPFADHGAEKEEAALQEFFVNTNGQQHRWLQEHKDYKLPLEKEALTSFKQHDIHTAKINHNSVDIWRPILAVNLLADSMHSQAAHQKSAALNAFYNKQLLFNDFTENSYRTFIVGSKKREIDYTAPSSKATVTDYARLSSLLTDFYSVVFGEHTAVPVLKQLSEDNAKLSLEVAGLNNEKQNIVNSKTWRYTEPARKVIKKAKGKHRA